MRAVFRDPNYVARELSRHRKVKPNDRDLIAGPGGVVAVLFNCSEAAGADGAAPCAVVPSAVLPEPEFGVRGMLLLDLAFAPSADGPVREVHLAFDWPDHRDFIPRLDRLLGLILLAGKRPAGMPLEYPQLVSLGRAGMLVVETAEDDEFPNIVGGLTAACAALDLLAPRCEAN